MNNRPRPDHQGKTRERWAERRQGQIVIAAAKMMAVAISPRLNGCEVRKSMQDG